MQRQRLNVPAAVESAIDAPSVREVLSDGTFVAEPDSHFEAASAAVASLVARDLNRAWADSASATGADDDPDRDAGRKWSLKVTSFIDAAIYELSQIIAVIDAIRTPANAPATAHAHTQVLDLCRSSASPTDHPLPSDDDVSGARLMAKSRALQAAADKLRVRSAALSAWAKEDDAYCEQLLELRAACGEIRRDSAGRACVDVGDSTWVPLTRVPFGVSVPALATLDLGVRRLDDDDAEMDVDLSHLPPIAEPARTVEEVTGLVHQSRMADFASRLFGRLLVEAKASNAVLELSSAALTIQCGPFHTVRIARHFPRTHRPQPKHDHPPKPSGLSSLLLQALLNQLALKEGLEVISRSDQPHAMPTTAPSSSAGRASPAQAHKLTAPATSTILVSLARRTAQRLSAEALEDAIDRAAALFRLVPEWSRDRAGTGLRASVRASEADGDGPSRLLATFVLGVDPGQVVVTPAFGVILPSMPENCSLSNRLEDVPGSFACSTMGGEVESLLALLLSVRLLDALESAGRVGRDMLDVDRQGFSVLVNFPGTPSNLRARVWADGKFERSEVTAWLDGVTVPFPTADQGGRLVRWKELLQSPSSTSAT